MSFVSPGVFQSEEPRQIVICIIGLPVGGIFANTALFVSLLGNAERTHLRWLAAVVRWQNVTILPL